MTRFVGDQYINDFCIKRFRAIGTTTFVVTERRTVLSPLPLGRAEKLKMGFAVFKRQGAAEEVREEIQGGH